MGKRWYYFLFMTWISYLLSSSLLLFTNGFFLTRIQRTERSRCTKCTLEKNCSSGEIFKDRQTSGSICLPPRSKVVLLIVDALKYEFVDWHENVEVDATYHLNKMPVVRDLLRSAPENTRLFKAIADAPTTTMQRLKALTTGTLPTFIDAGSNFASESISEDNLIDQSREYGGVVFMGDDTWISLYPNKFLRQLPSPSFNVWDLDTVDRQVRDAIVPELRKTDWSLLVAHVLGVDHCGHKHGPYHPEMARKLRETNDLVALIVESLPEETTLIVMGDHGMTESGDHGGDSRNEIEAGMLVYSRLPLLGKKNEQVGNVVNQIDVVPTISSLLGVPIPFSNIGAVILECLPRTSERHQEKPFWFAAHSLWRNVEQMKKYIEAYSNDSFLFGEEQLQEINRLYSAVEDNAGSVNDENSFQRFAERSKEYLQTVRNLCAEIWIQFDPGLMSKGLIIFFCVLFFVYIMLSALDEPRTNEIMRTSFLFVSIVSNLLTSLTTFGLYKFGFLEEFKNLNTFATGTVSVSFLALLVAQNWDTISSTWYNSVKLKKVHYLERGIILLSFCGLFSNSYIVEEDKVLMYLLVTMVALLMVKTIDDDTSFLAGSGEKKWKQDKNVARRKSAKYFWILVGLVACAAIRLSSYLWRCREEQDRDTCILMAKKSDLLSHAGTERTLLIVSVVSLAMYVTIVTSWLRNTERLSDFFPIANIARYCYGVIAVTIGCYWVYERLPKEARVKVAISRQINALPGIAYFFALFGIANVYFRPLGIFWLPPKSEQLTVDDRRAPSFFTRLRELFYSRQFVDESEFPMISSSITFYSSAFISLSVFLTLLWALVLGNVFALGTFLMFVTCTAILGLVAIERCHNANNLGESSFLMSPADYESCGIF